MGNATLAVYGRLGSDPRDREKARRRRSANADAACPQVAPENLPAELENLGPRQRRFTLIFTALGTARKPRDRPDTAKNRLEASARRT